MNERPNIVPHYVIHSDGADYRIRPPSNSCVQDGRHGVVIEKRRQTRLTEERSDFPWEGGSLFISPKALADVTVALERMLPETDKVPSMDRLQDRSWRQSNELREAEDAPALLLAAAIDAFRAAGGTRERFDEVSKTLFEFAPPTTPYRQVLAITQVRLFDCASIINTSLREVTTDALASEGKS